MRAGFSNLWFYRTGRMSRWSLLPITHVCLPRIESQKNRSCLLLSMQSTKLSLRSRVEKTAESTVQNQRKTASVCNHGADLYARSSVEETVGGDQLMYSWSGNSIALPEA